MKFKIALVILVSMFLAGKASAIGFTFVQSGFAEGATVTGAFFGEDLNSDGFLAGQSGAPSEIAFFSAFWSGNTNAPAFSISSDDPVTWSIVYELGWNGGFLGDNLLEFTFNIGAGGGYLASGIGGAIYTGDVDPADFTQNLAVVYPLERVNDSGGALALFSMGLGLLVYARRRRS